MPPLEDEEMIDEADLSEDDGSVLSLVITKLDRPKPVLSPVLQPVLPPIPPLVLNPIPQNANVGQQNEEEKIEAPKKIDRNGFSEGFNKLCPGYVETKRQDDGGQKSVADIIKFRKTLRLKNTTETENIPAT